MKRTFLSLWLATILLTACGTSPTETTTTVTTDADAADWTVNNPSSGATIQVHRFLPSDRSLESIPALVLVPGSSSDSSTFLKQDEAQRLADEGFEVITFDPDGRGDSSGEEDYNGFVQQDGLKAVIESVDNDHIGLVTFSYGITMGSGVLARYPELPVEFLIDWEGPADRNDTGGCDKDKTGHLTEVANCDDEEFWAEREAVTFIAQIEVPYQRIQSAKDHAQPDNLHALAMVNAAVRGGKCPWVRLNNGTVNADYSEKGTGSRPEFFPENQDPQRDTRIAEYAQELFELN